MKSVTSIWMDLFSRYRAISSSVRQSEVMGSAVVVGRATSMLHHTVDIPCQFFDRKRAAPEALQLATL